MVESVPWSAEEFEGELVDRVRRPVHSDFHDDESTEAAAGGRGKTDRPRLYETDSASNEPDSDELESGELDSADPESSDSGHSDRAGLRSPAGRQ